MTQLLRKSNAFVEKMQHSRQNSIQTLEPATKNDDEDAGSEERDEVLEIEDA